MVGNHIPKTVCKLLLKMEELSYIVKIVIQHKSMAFFSIHYC